MSEILIIKLYTKNQWNLIIISMYPIFYATECEKSIWTCMYFSI